MKQIPFAKKYSIDKVGNIFSSVTNKFISSHLMKCGYMRVKLICDDGVQRSFLVHRLVALTYIDNPLNKKEVNHINGIKSDNRLVNLEWVTRSENQKHAFSSGLNDNSGINNGRSLLVIEQVLEIYWKLFNGARNSDVAKEYGISNTAVMEIKSKKNWTEVTASLPDIPIKSKSERLSDKTVEWVCQMIENGVCPKEIYDLCKNKSVKLDQIYDIKRRRGFKHISCKYNW